MKNEKLKIKNEKILDQELENFFFECNTMLYELTRMNRMIFAKQKHKFSNSLILDKI